MEPDDDGIGEGHRSAQYPGERYRTRLRRASRLEAVLGFTRLFIKFEHDNPTGTHKDRAAEASVHDALRHGYAGITAGTCGSLGVSLSYYAQLNRLSCSLFMPPYSSSTARERMMMFGSGVVDVRGTYEDAVDASHAFAVQHEWYDANPDGPHAAIAVAAYSLLGREILIQLTESPNSVWVPAGNGTTALGVLQSIIRLSPSTVLGIVGSHGNTAVTASLRSGEATLLDRKSVIETKANAPLVNWRSAQTLELLDLARTPGVGIEVYEASDDQLVRAAGLIAHHEEQPVEQASSAPLVGLEAAVRRSRMEASATHVLVMTS